MARGPYETTGTPKPAPKPKPKATTTTTLSSDNGGNDKDVGSSRFEAIVNYNRSTAAAEEDGCSSSFGGDGGRGLVNLGRAGYDITNSPKPAPKPASPGSPTPKPPQQPKPEKPGKPEN